MQQLESEFQRLIVATRGEAAADTLGDAILLITDMWGQAEMRKILMAVVGLDDILASGQLGSVERDEVLEVQGRLRGVLDGGFGSVGACEADDINDYAVAMFMIGAVYGDFTREVYDRLEEVHADMTATEEAAAAEAAQAAQAAQAAPQEPVEQAFIDPAADRQRMIAARLARFG